MGVPAFYRWLSQKYPKIVVDVLEDEKNVVDGVEVPVDTSQPNPNGTEFDNLYLDMNGIIHPCTHPEGEAAPPTEEDMMVTIMMYIDRLFGMVRPRKILYMAIDGVAPRAKMNQQRSRRFRAAKDAKDKAEIEAKIKSDLEAQGNYRPPLDGETKDKFVFDSNCITPGTPFMEKVAIFLHFYITERLNNDPGWKGIKVILTDSNVPGEGEHKIMEFIRLQRSQPGYDPNTRHVIYGLDADLIMLGLATHEPHFSILREIVFFGNNNNCYVCGQPGHLASACQGKPKEKSGEHDEKSLMKKPFQFLHLNVLREYLDQNLRPEHAPGFVWNLEAGLDDWVFMCYFVGNDFLPHLPTLEIRDGAIDLLVRLYKKILPRTGYLTCDGEVHVDRAEVLMQEVGVLEDSILVERMEKEKRREQRERDRKRNEKRAILSNEDLEARRAREAAARAVRLAGPGSSDSPAVNSMKNLDAASKLRAALLGQVPSPGGASSPAGGLVGIKRPGSAPAGLQSAEPAEKKARTDDVDEDEGPKDEVRLGEAGWKERYYRAKFGFELDNEDGFRKLRRSYIEGLAWVLKYYYSGCASWKWFYPYHYAPFTSEMKDVDRDITFELGQPFKPVEQLMGVLPAASKQHVPVAYQYLMTDPDSPIIDFYPETFPIDMNGKKQAWQGVALLPWIEEHRLLTAIEPHNHELTADEQRRNALGTDILFCRADHPLAAQLFDPPPANEPRELDYSRGQLFGKVYKFEGVYPVGATHPSPYKEKLDDIPNCQVVAVRFKYPEIPAGGIKRGILADITMPPKILSGEDFFSPRERRGGPMQNSPMNRMINHHLPTGQYKEGSPQFVPGGFVGGQSPHTPHGRVPAYDGPLFPVTGRGSPAPYRAGPPQFSTPQPHQQSRFPQQFQHGSAPPRQAAPAYRGYEQPRGYDDPSASFQAPSRGPPPAAGHYNSTFTPRGPPARGVTQGNPYLASSPASPYTPPPANPYLASSPGNPYMSSPYNASRDPRRGPSPGRRY
eukprot:TRINITY_DN6088_c0_g1_i1.p1 TRINITY_DN6088_c0_g1~~TRINITY_DN6088_c0_g1_i1.p1  ORF type:complete len:1011 (-),score=391.46 TRINITY_DN6088_c0_g1_i1:223-3255(-)